MIGRVVVRAWVLLALALGGAGAAQAQVQNFDFSFTTSGLSVMGTFVTTSQGNGQYLITDILNGMRGGNPIALVAPYRGVTGTNDNILIFPANPAYFDSSGFDYTTGSRTYNVNYSSGFYYEFPSTGGLTGVSNLTISPSPAPLPGGGLLSFLALGLAGLIHRRRTVLARGREALARLRLRPTAGPA